MLAMFEPSLVTPARARAPAGSVVVSASRDSHPNLPRPCGVSLTIE